MSPAIWLRSTGTKQTDLAYEIGVSPSYISMLCKGQIWPGREIATRLLKATGGQVTPNDILALGPESGRHRLGEPAPEAAT